MSDIPREVSWNAGNLNDGQEYERKLLIFIAASLTKHKDVDGFWIVSNPEGIDKIDDVVVRISFKNRKNDDVALFIQSKLTSPNKLLWLRLNNKRPTKKCYEIKLREYEEAFDKVVEMLSANSPENPALEPVPKTDRRKCEVELQKLFEDVNKNNYFVCIFTNMETVEPELQCKQFDECHPIYFLDTRKCGQYRQFDHDVENSTFYKQLFVFLGQVDFEGMDTSVAQLLGVEYKHRLENLVKLIKGFMQRKNGTQQILTKQTFEINWFKILVTDWVNTNLEKVEEINPKFEILWQKILANRKVINLWDDQIWPLLAHHYQCVVRREVDPNFDWKTGVTAITTNFIEEKYNETVTELRHLLFLLWLEGKAPLPIRSDCTRELLKFVEDFKTIEGAFVVFISEDRPAVITYMKEISDKDTLEELNKVEVSLQGRHPVKLSSISDESVIRVLKISQVLQWTKNISHECQHIIGPILRRPDDNYIERTFTKTLNKVKGHSADRTQKIKKKPFSIHESNIRQKILPRNKVLEDDDFLSQQRELFTVEDIVKTATPGLYVITAEPGMGKSTVLQALAHSYSPQVFVIYITLRDCLNDIENDNTWPTIKSDPIEYFFNKMSGSANDGIAQVIFQSHKTRKRLCLILDGYDEILPLHGERILSLMANIVHDFTIPVFCTTRPHGEELITDVVTRLKLSPFKRGQIEQYIEIMKINVDHIIEHFDGNFLGNPLHLNMISEIHEKFREHISITKGKMYKMFIELKYEKYNQKIGLSKNYAQLLIVQSMNNHRKLALVEIFGKEFVTSNGLLQDSELVEILDEIADHNIGIVNVLKLNGSFQFVHRTFAEYLVADWLLQMAKKDNSDIAFQYIYEEVVCNHRDIYYLLSELGRCYEVWSQSFLPNINIDIFKLDELGRNVAHAATIAFEELEESVLKSALFYRKDLILKCTCKEFHDGKPYGNLSVTIDEINEDFPTCRQLRATDYESTMNLLTAVDSGNKDDVYTILKFQEFLLETGLGVVAFHSAIARGNQAIVQLLLDLRPMLLNEADGNQNTAMHIACAFGHRNTITLLLEKQANQEIRNVDTRTPLDIATAAGHLDIVSLLVDHIRKSEDGVAGHSSSTEHYSKLFWKALIVACRTGRVDVATYLIDNGADLTLSDDDGWTAVHYAAHKGQLDILSLLVERGLEVNAKSHRGAIPIGVSIGNAQLEAVRWLLEHGADPEHVDEDGWISMHYAAQKGQIDILEILLERGVNINAITNWGETPLTISIDYEQWGSFTWLLDHGANPVS